MLPLFFPYIAFLLISVVTAEPNSDSALEKKEITTNKTNDQSDISDGTESDTGEAEESTTSDLLELIDKSVFDLPMVYNEEVIRWVHHFSNSGRWTASKWIRASGKYRNLIQAELRKANMPEDLLYLAMIESGFDPTAQSIASASGVWQFIPETGKDYGLTINDVIDERRDPIRSTQAAIRYLKKLYLEFGNWHLAIAAYNAGEARIYRAISEHGTINYWELCQKEALAKETMEYVPKILALSILDRYPKLFGVPSTEKKAKPITTKIASAERNQHVQTLADAAEMELEQFLEYNPHILANRLLVADADITIYLPPHKADVYSQNIRRTNVNRLSSGRSMTKEELAILEKERQKEIIIPEHKRQFHYVVKADDTWESIAKETGLSISQLQRWNHTTLKEGDTLSLQAPPPKKPTQHVVKSGESLKSIAKKYGCSIDDIRRWNALSEDKKISKGDVIWLQL